MCAGPPRASLLPAATPCCEHYDSGSDACKHIRIVKLGSCSEQPLPAKQQWLSPLDISRHYFAGRTRCAASQRCLQLVMKVSCLLSGSKRTSWPPAEHSKSWDRKASLRHFRLKRCGLHIYAVRRRHRESEDDYRPSKMLSSRQHLAERKAKQAGYVALRGPGQVPTLRT